LSIISFNQILQFDPAIYHFNVPTVNTKLSHLFTLATTSSRLLTDAERIQHTLTVYQRIQQPEIWAQWIRNQVDSFESGNITNCQAFMNTAVVKYNKIRVETEDHAFPGSASTLQEDIVAMMAASKRKRVPNPTDKPKPADNDSNKERRNQTALPTFARHFKGKEADGGKAYKVGDTKKWKDATWYYCDCPNHRDRIKWHTHTAEDCRTRKNWLDKGGAKAPTVANAAVEEEDEDPPTPPDDDEGAPNDLTAMLANALSLAHKHSVASDMIAHALEALSHT
jgi:hypothetical protein